MTRRAFHIGDALSVTTGHLVSLRHMPGVYDVLQHLHGCEIYPHQIPRAISDAAPFVYEQHPALAFVDATTITPENWREWLQQQVERFGEQIELAPIPNAAELRRDPVDEAVEMAGKDRVIVLKEGEL